MKRLLPIIFVLACVKSSFSQPNAASWLAIPTPNAAAIARYGDIPVSYFSGLAQIKVPLWELSCWNESVPVALDYHGGGIRADEHPGTAGLGWSLTAGGVITRNVRGGPDEYQCADPTYYYFRGYYDCGNKLNTTDWSSNSQLTTHKLYPQDAAQYVDDGIPDEFSFSFLNHSGKFFLNENQEWQVVSSEDLTFSVSFAFADDFILPDVGNASYSATLKRIFKSFVITTGDGYQYYFGGSPETIEFSRGSYNNLTVSNGYTQYVTPISWYLTKVVAPNKEEVDFTYERGEPLFEKRKVRSVGTIQNTGGIANTTETSESTVGSATNPVYLKKITSSGQEVNFYYSTSMEKMYTNFSANENNHMNGSINEALLLWPDFHSTYAGIGVHEELLPHKYRQLDQVVIKDKSGAVMRNISFDFDNVMESPSEALRRLTLFRVHIADAANTASEEYKFEYNNPELLPDYGVRQSDHWGYYNGVNYMGTNSTPYQFDNWRQPDATKMAYGTLTKITYPTGGTTEFVYEPHTYSRAVNLTSNPAAFSYAFSVGNEGSDKMAGGLRIKKIISTPLYGGLPLIKEYKYELEGSSASSGILAGKPFYVDMMKTDLPACATNCGPVSTGYGGTWTFTHKIDNSSYQPISLTNGNHVTYSKVKELLPDGSYTDYYYTNYDSPDALDEIHTGLGTDGHTNYATGYCISSKEIERGLLTLKKIYNSGNTLRQSSAYEYTNDRSPATAFAKAVDVRVHKTGLMQPCGPNTDGCIMYAGCIWATKKYAYNKLLKKVTETTYETGSPIETFSEYTYDQYRNKLTTKTKSSDNQFLVQQTKYNSHADYLGAATSNEAIAVKQLFSDYKINNYPVEQLTLMRNTNPLVFPQDKIIAGKLFQYDYNSPNLTTIRSLELTEPVWPVTYNSSLQPVYHFTYSKNQNGLFVYDERYKLQSNVNSFTSLPAGIIKRPLSITANNANTAYTWDYAAAYQSSATQNAQATEVAFSSFEGSYLPLGSSDDNEGNWIFSKDNITTGGFTGSKCLDVTAASPAFTSRYALTSGRSYRLSFWAKGGTPVIFINGVALPQSYATLKQSGSWSYYSIPLTGTGQTVGIRGSGFPGTLWVDEVRLYTEGALMKSYTFNAATGNPTTITDETGITTFYTYDGLDRLLFIKDEQGNVLKKYTYQLQGAE